MASTAQRAEAWAYAQLVAGLAGAGIGTPPRIYAGRPPQHAQYPCCVYAVVAATDNGALGPQRMPSRVVLSARGVAATEAPEDLDALVAAIDASLQTPPWTPPTGAVLCCQREDELVYLGDSAGVAVWHRGARYGLTTTPG